MPPKSVSQGSPGMTNTNSFEAWTDRLAQRPEIFPHQLDLMGDRVLLVELSAAEVSAASFLDQRVLKQTTKGTWIPWQSIVDIFKDASEGEPAGFIFHVGHCGSTLLSRLLAFADNTQSLREPLPLRTLAQDLANADDGRSFLDGRARQERLHLLTKMWCRGARHTVIKATSVCTGLLSQLNSTAPGTKSVFIYNRPETHIATLLSGQNALLDLKGFAQLRLQRLQHICGLDIQLNQLSIGQLAALSWLSETTSTVSALEKAPENVTQLEFESLLQDPAGTLTHVLNHLKIPASSEIIEKAVNSSVLQTYSKAPEHKYNAQTRAAILSDSRAKFQQEIRDALAWLEKLAGQSEIIASSLQKFA